MTKLPGFPRWSWGFEAIFGADSGFPGPERLRRADSPPPADATRASSSPPAAGSAASARVAHCQGYDKHGKHARRRRWGRQTSAQSTRRAWLRTLTRLPRCRKSVSCYQEQVWFFSPWWNSSSSHPCWHKDVVCTSNDNTCSARLASSTEQQQYGELGEI